MKYFLVCVGWYYGISFIVGIGFLIELLILTIFHDEKRPILSRNYAKLNTIMFLTGIWFPMIIIKVFKDTFIGD